MIEGPLWKQPSLQRKVDGPKPGLDEACLGSMTGSEAYQAGGAPAANQGAWRFQRLKRELFLHLDRLIR